MSKNIVLLDSRYALYSDANNSNKFIFFFQINDEKQNKIFIFKSTGRGPAAFILKYKYKNINGHISNRYRVEHCHIYIIPFLPTEDLDFLFGDIFDSESGNVIRLQIRRFSL